MYAKNCILVFPILFASVMQIECYNLKEVAVPNNVDNIKVFTDDDIAQFDGSKEDLPIYMAVKGVVFDVTSGKGFYGKGAAYNALVGKDASRAVAKMSLEPSDLNRDLTGLGDSILKSLDEVFEGTYMEKYPVVGYMEYLINGEDERLYKRKVKTDL